MTFPFKRRPFQLTIPSLVALVLSLTFIASAASQDVAQQWVDKGLEISKSNPNSDEEAQCYIRAIEADPNYASAHFNLAFVLDAQAVRNWQGPETAWSDLDRLYAALDHYAATARLDPPREAAYANSVRIAGLLFETQTKRPPDLHRIRAQLSTCVEALDKTKDQEAQSYLKELRLLVLRIEERIGQLKGCHPDKNVVSAQEIVKRLSRSFTRGQSPYQGPRVPLIIHFDLNKASIRPESAEQLKEMARALKTQRLVDRLILIEGHADSLGAEGYNQRLSEKRAKSVKEYLVKNFSLPRERFQIRGYGETRPLVPNDTDEHRSMNRRVEFVNSTELDSFRSQIRNRKRSGDVDAYDVLY